MKNRELKFRAWDEAQKVMHNDFQFVKSGNNGNGWILFTSDKHPVSDYDGWIKNPYFQQQLIIMQYTGLKDKNGKEIYEGDILQNTQHGFFGVVKYGSCCFWVYETNENEDKIQWSLGSGMVYKIIGNIHENPELLK